MRNKEEQTCENINLGKYTCKKEKYKKEIGKEITENTRKKERKKIGKIYVLYNLNI